MNPDDGSLALTPTHLAYVRRVKSAHADIFAEAHTYAAAGNESVPQS